MLIDGIAAGAGAGDCLFDLFRGGDREYASPFGSGGFTTGGLDI